MLLVRVASRKIRRFKILEMKNKMNYNNLLGRPIVDSISINSHISSNIVKNSASLFFILKKEMLKFFKYDLGLNWGCSIFLGSVIIRFVCSAIKYLVQVK